MITCLGVCFQQGERGPRHGSKPMTNIRPTKTLFVINFDPIRTRVRDIERHFEPYGNILNVRIRRNFAFVQFETQKEATKALECTNMRLDFLFFPFFNNFYAENLYSTVWNFLVVTCYCCVFLFYSKVSMLLLCTCLFVLHLF